MIELLIVAAGRLAFGPILGRVWADVQQSAADQAEGVVKRWWKRTFDAPDAVLTAGEASTPMAGPTPAASDSDRTEETDDEIAQSMVHDAENADRLRRAVEEILGVSLSQTATGTGTGGAMLSAYEAVIWRAAVVAGWELRPVALAGSLLGPDWVTVCKPLPSLEPGSVIQPSSLWVTDDEGDLIRSKTALVEFYMRRCGDTDADDLNERFIRDRSFVPGPAGPLGQVWHRIDGLNRGWVRFRWDDKVMKHVQNRRNPPIPSFLTGGHLEGPRVDLDEEPPRYSEFPPAWQDAMKIADPEAAVRTLRQAIDKFVAANAASLEAARAALN